MKSSTKEVKQKTTNNQITETPKFHGKTDEEILEMIQNLETQEAQQLQVIQQAQTTLQQAQTMLLKIQGALELARQMVSKEMETNNEAKESN